MTCALASQCWQPTRWRQKQNSGATTTLTSNFKAAAAAGPVGRAAFPAFCLHNAVNLISGDTNSLARPPVESTDEPGRPLETRSGRHLLAWIMLILASNPFAALSAGRLAGVAHECSQGRGHRSQWIESVDRMKKVTPQAIVCGGSPAAFGLCVCLSVATREREGFLGRSLSVSAEPV